MPWNGGILECWNNGLRKMGSVFDSIGKSEIKIKTFSVFYTQYSTIPLFHWWPKGKLHPSEVKSKPGPLGQDSLT
jgi:hypothetical protein